MIQDSAYLETILMDVHDWLGVAFAKEGRYPEAIKEFRESIRLTPDAAETHRNLGNALASTGSVEGAIAEFKQAVRLDPNDGQTFINLGSTLLDAKQYAAAIDVLRQALRLMPVSSEVHNKIGLALLASQGSVDEAILEFELALKLRPEFEDAKRNLARARQSQGRR
jgi:tetratricopeptide (TPR) repeat protein